MKIIVENMAGDASVTFYNKQGEVIHVEAFYGKTSTDYIREVPVDPVEYGYTKAVYSGRFKYVVSQ